MFSERYVIHLTSVRTLLGGRSRLAEFGQIKIVTAPEKNGVYRTLSDCLPTGEMGSPWLSRRDGT
jgi:hypothetical protein